MTDEEKLANAIIMQAADDWRYARRRLWNSTYDYTERANLRFVEIIKDCESFLRKNRYIESCVGESVLNHIKEEFENGERLVEAGNKALSVGAKKAEYICPVCGRTASVKVTVYNAKNLYCDFRRERRTYRCRCGLHEIRWTSGGN